MGMNEIANLVGSLGFPIVVAGFLMIKLDKTLQIMNKTINEFAITNREVLQKLTERE